MSNCACVFSFTLFVIVTAAAAAPSQHSHSITTFFSSLSSASTDALSLKQVPPHSSPLILSPHHKSSFLSSSSSSASSSSSSSLSSLSSSSFSVSASSCVNSCSNVGLCIALSTGGYACQCPRGYLAADCSLFTSTSTGINVVSGDFTLGTYGTATHEFALIYNSSQLTPTTAVPSSTLIHVRWTIPSTNAFGAILNVGWDGMTSGDCWTYTTSGSAATMSDYFSSGRSSPSSDSQQDLTQILGFTTNGYTIMEFTRKLVTTDTKSDLALPLVAGQYTRFMWAVLGGTGGTGNGKDKLPMHNYIGSIGQFQVDFVGGTFVELSDGVKWPTGYYYALVILIVVMVGAGLERYVIRPFPSVFRVILHQTPLTIFGLTESTVQGKIGSDGDRDKSDSMCDCLHTCTCDFLPALLSLSVLELKIVALYFAMISLLIVKSQSEYTDVGRSWLYVFGHVTSLHYALSLLPVTKNSVFLPLFGISRNSTAIAWHRRIGRVTLLFTFIHGASQAFAIWNAAVLFYTPDCQYGMGAIFGTASLICLVAVTMTSVNRCRRNSWSRFYLCHIGCLSMGYVFAMLHSIQLRWFSVVAGVLWCIDIIVRWVVRPCCLLRKVFVSDIRVFDAESADRQEGPGERMEGAAPVVINPIKRIDGAIVRLQLRVPASFKYEAGDYVYLYVPELSKYIWHPFTISSFDKKWQRYRGGSGNNSNLSNNNKKNETDITLHIRANDPEKGNGWTARLLQRCVELQQQQQAQPHEGMVKYPLSVSIDGPYKSYDIPLLNFDYVILVAGGIGVTPAASYLSDYVYRRYSGESGLHVPRHFHFVWVARSQAIFTRAEGGVDTELMRELCCLHHAGDEGAVKNNNDNNNNNGSNGVYEGEREASPSLEAVSPPVEPAIDELRHIATNRVTVHPFRSASPSSSSASPPPPASSSASLSHRPSSFTMSLYMTGPTNGVSQQQRHDGVARTRQIDRQVQEVEMFSNSLGGNGGSDGMPSVSMESAVSPLVMNGRPSFSSMGETTRKQLALHGIRPFNVGVFACGPMGMVMNAKSMCQQHGFYFMEDGFIM